MTRDLPPFEPSRRQPPTAGAAIAQRRYNPYIIVTIVLFAVFSFYTALIVGTQLDDEFLPGNEFKASVLGITPPGVDSGEDPAFADLEERINILVMGLDLRRDEPPDTPGRTDSVFIMSIDPFSKTGGILSIPRDLAVDIPDGYGGHVFDRINVAYEMGEYTYTGYPGGGAGLAKDTIERNFGIPIDYYVLLNFNNFIEIVDELGGIDIDVPEYVYDSAYNDCKYCPYYPVEFVEGPQHMDGETALTYARLRKSDNDFKRIERQQLVMQAVAMKAADLGTLLGSNPLNLYKKYKGSVKTDVPDTKIPGLALLGRQIGVDNLRMESLASATYPCGYACGGAAMLLGDRDGISEIVARIFSDGKLQSEGAVVKLLNGTSTPELADDFAAYLRAQGITPEQIAIDDYAGGALYNSTLVVDLSGKQYTAQKLAGWLKLPAARIKEATDPEAVQFSDPAANVVVILGADAVVPDLTSASIVRVPYDPGITYIPPAYEPEVTPEETYVEPEPEETPAETPVWEPEETPLETPVETPVETPEPEPIETPLADTTTAGG